MAVTYSRLLKMLIDRKMSTAQLRNRAGVSANIITRLKKDEYISLESIERICTALDCGVDEILEFIPKGGTNDDAK
ncbi:helix-turn-helix domain-containing protein [Mordavella massiliensis]|uniref:Helix-turn-helix transcriptional regulator n=1 Tax=Mordavella massiliensis TaxID=1871024 RepID=A0A938X350_9CLOT|nr:helix-turn-helix transcriptional regulator [Mordavella massiliensis]MBM6827760.1 helix-turn-helix transcriptional regulator [Mordavella massiliensis]